MLLLLLYPPAPDYIVISPFHVPSVSPSVCTHLCHRSPPRSRRRRYASSFCRRCTSSLRLRLFALSCPPRLARKSASVRILAVRIAACTSGEPVSGPLPRNAPRRGVSPAARRSSSLSRTSRPVGRTGRPEEASSVAGASDSHRKRSVRCRPKKSTHRCLLCRNRSLLLPLPSWTMRPMAMRARWSSRAASAAAGEAACSPSVGGGP